MDTKSIISATFIAAFVWFSYSQPASAQKTRPGHVYIPCAAYSEGNAWIYKTSDDNMFIEEEAVVISNKNNVIVIGNKTKTILQTGPHKNIIANENRETLRKEGNTVFFVGMKMEKLDIGQVDMRLPICGEVPETATIVTKTGYMTVEETRSIRVVGRDRVSVPSGNFDVVVVEVTTKAKPGSSVVGNSDRVETMYVAEKVGMVRQVRKTFLPDYAGMLDPKKEARVNEIMQKGVEAMSRGENAGKYFRQLEELSQEEGDRNKVPERLKARVSIKELQRYHLN